MPKFISNCAAVVFIIGALAAAAKAQTFTDNFTPAPSVLWNNYAGNWTAVSGQYYAQNAKNNPLTATALPFVVGNFSLTITANNLTDGGIWIHSDGTNQNGLLLVLGGENYGQGSRGGAAGNSIYWQEIQGGGYHTGAEDEVTGAFTTGNNYTITVTGVGNTYSAYINSSPTPVTTYTTTSDPTGQIGLYDDQPNVGSGGSGNPMTFSNFSLTATGVPEPASAALLVIALPALYMRSNRLKG